MLLWWNGWPFTLPRSALASTPETTLHKSPPGSQNIRLQGHGDTVEDLVFRPGSAEELVSVGDDKAVLLWDRRTGEETLVQTNHPVSHVEAWRWEWGCARLLWVHKPSEEPPPQTQRAAWAEMGASGSGVRVEGTAACTAGG